MAAMIFPLIASVFLGCATFGGGVDNNAVSFSPASGSLDKKTDLTLTSSVPEAKILFTLDGKKPDPAVLRSDAGGSPSVPASGKAASPVPSASDQVSTKVYDKKLVLDPPVWGKEQSPKKVVIHARSVSDGKASGVAVAEYSLKGTVPKPDGSRLETADQGNGTAFVVFKPVPGARIHYTLDGSMPGPEFGAMYVGVPVEMGSGMTLRAIAWKEGWNESALFEFKNAGAVPATRVPVQGTVPAGTPGILTTTTTIPGSVPATTRPAVQNSPAVQTVRPVPQAIPAPVFMPAQGSFSEPQQVTLSIPGQSAGMPLKIRYTIDGSVPGAESLVYDSPILVTSTTTIKAVTIGQDSTGLPAKSDVITARYDFAGSLPPPEIMPPSGRYASSQLLGMKSVEGSTIRYTLDGSTPSADHGMVYSSPFAPKGEITLIAVVSKPGWKDSAPVKMSYTFVELPEMVEVPAGTFNMGSAAGTGENDERPLHAVTLPSYSMSKYEVTQEQYRLVMGTNPSFFKDGPEAPRRPVEQVSWFNAIGYCNALSDIAGLPRVYTVTGSTVVADFAKPGYRLPTEAEWEFAARGGTQGTLPGKMQPRYSGSDEPDKVAWSQRTSGGSTKPVGILAPNLLGLHDMTGNVWEWCHDWYGIYPSAGTKALEDPKGPTTGTKRVKRGGSWNRLPEFSRNSFRNYHSPQNSDRTLGFRVVRTEVK